MIDKYEKIERKRYMRYIIQSYIIINLKE